MIMEETYMFQDLRECAHAAVRCLEENREALLALSSLVQKAQPSSIVLAARGTSLHAATFAKYLFEEFVGLPTAVAEPSVVTKYAGKLDLSHSLVIGISQSGEGLDVCGIAARGRDCGGIAAASPTLLPPAWPPSPRSVWTAAPVRKRAFPPPRASLPS